MTNLVKYTNSLLNASNAKCPESATREVSISNHCIDLSNPDSGQVLVKNIWQKTIPSKLVIHSNLLNSTRNLNSRRVSMGIFPDDLEQVYDNMTEHKIASEVIPKLIKDWNNTKGSPSHSVLVPE